MSKINTILKAAEEERKAMQEGKRGPLKSSSSPSTKKTVLTTMPTQATKTTNKTANVGGKTAALLKAAEEERKAERTKTTSPVKINSKSFSTESKHAYSKVKTNASSKTTITSNLSDKDRQARIKEIEAEIKTLNDKIYGLGRASGYGMQTETLKTMSEEAKKRKAELSEELKTLKRTGTFTASELKQFEIDDAKAKTNALKQKVPSSGRVTPAQAEQYKENAISLYQSQQELNKLESQKELYDKIAKFSDVVNEDTFIGQTKANYRNAELSREADKAMNDYLSNPTEENKEIAYAYDAFVRAYAENNKNALDDENVKASWISKSAAGYMPQFLDQIVPEVIGGVAGGLLGSAVGAPTVGASLGAGMATSAQMYGVMRGSVYRTLLAEGVDEETALQAANDEALLSSIIEGGETALSWLLAGGGKALKAIGNAATKSVAKGSTNAATKYVANKLLTTSAKKASQSALKTGIKVGAGIVGNGLSEYGEEFAQQAVSIANKDRALRGSDESLIIGSGKVIKDAVTGKNDKNFAEMHEAGMEGLKIGLMFGGASTVANNAVSRFFNAKTIKEQNEELDFIRSAEGEEALDALIEEGKATGEGTVSHKIATEIETAKANGKEVTRDQVKRLIASNDVYIENEEKMAQADPLEQAAREVVEGRNTSKHTSPVQMAENLSKRGQKLTVEEVKEASGYGDNGAKVLTEIVNNSQGKTFSQVKSDIHTSYLAGLSNAEIKSEGKINMEAYLAGKTDREISKIKATEGIFKNRVFSREESGLITPESKNKGDLNPVAVPKTVSRKMVKALDLVGKALGRKVMFVDSITVNGREDAANAQMRSDGVFEISVKSEQPLYELLFHEPLHIMRQENTAEYHVFVDFAVQHAEYLDLRLDVGNSRGTKFEGNIAQYQKYDLSIDYDANIEEIAAHFAEKLASGDRDAIRLIEKMAQDSNSRTALQKFFDVLKDVIDKCVELWNRLKKQGEYSAAEELGITISELKKAKELYAKALTATQKAAEKRVVEQKNSNTKATERAEVVAKNETTAEGKADFSLKEFEGKSIVWIEESGLSNKQLNNHQAVADYIEQHIGEVYTIIESGQKVYIGEDLPQEYTQSKYTTYLRGVNPTAARGKNKAIDGFGELIETATNRRWEKTKHTQNKDAKYGMYRYDNSFAFPIRDNKGNVTKVRAFDVELLIRNASDGNKYLYDIVGIKENTVAEIGLLERMTRLPNESQATRDSVSNERIPQNPKSVKSNYSLKDSLGNTLTEAQQEYFKDSKVRDENGNLLVMYHGTSEDFTIFDKKKARASGTYGRGFYFTRESNHANHYGEAKAYYLKIDNPLSTNEKTITKAQLKKFLEVIAEDEDYGLDNYGYGSTVESIIDGIYDDSDASRPEYQKTDFSILWDVNLTAIGNMVEAVELFNKVNGTSFDGFILPTETVTFNSEQAKLTSNENPTSNPDIRFSLKKSVEETKDLIAVHNVRENKLLEALKLGGLPSPSIAITKKDMSHDKFGDISLVFRKETISPTDRRNKIYSGDAYTPTSVRVEYDVDDDVVQEFNKRLKELTPEWANERLPSVDSGTADVENDSLYNAYERNDRAKLAFLREKGKAPKVAMRTPMLSTFVSNDTVVALAKAFTAKQLNDIANTSEGVKQYKNAFLKVIRDVEDSRAVETGIYSADEASLFDIAETARKAASVKGNKYKIKKEVDTRKTYELIDKKFTKALKAEYRAWIDENTKAAIVDKGIRNNRDLFTPSGSRRSFKQLHEPYNLGNIVKQMFSGEDKGIALFGGSPIGAAQHEYSSIADVKADSSRLQALEQEEYDKIRGQIEDDVFELARKMQTNSDVFAIRDLLTEAIGKKTKQQADVYLRRESQGWAKYSPEFADELWSIRERILNMPTEYFEAKPQRAVGFNEIALAVLPKGMTTLRKQLIDAGVQKVVYYDRNIDGDRLKKINSVPDVNFSLKRDTDLSTKDTKALLDIIEHLKGEFEVTKFAKADSKKLAKLTKDILKEYSSQADYDTTFKAIDDLYQYLANGEEGHPAVWDDVYNRAYDIAENIVEKALVLDDELYSQYSNLRQYLRNTPMKFDSRYDSVPSSYENFQDFRRYNWGRLNFTKDGTAIDKVYQELSDLYPEFFDSSEQMNAADQLERIIDVLDEIQPTEINPYSREVSQVASYLANDIIDRFFDVPQAKATFADKAERRVAEARIAGGKKVEAVRQQKDEKIKKLIESQKAKTKRQIDKLRQQRDAKVKKEQEKRREAISRMSESQKAKVLRAQITRHASDLGRKLISPTDNQHIPEDLRGVVATLLESINLESNYSYDTESHSYKKNDEGLPSRRTKAFEDLRKLYSQIASSVVVDPDLVAEGGLLSDVISLADKRIADMNSTELETVWNTLRAIEASVNTANKVFSQGKFETILGFAEALREDNAGKKEKTEYKGVLGKGKTLATLNMLTPETYFHYLGSAGDSIFRMMRDAQDKHISIMKEVADFTRKTLKGVNVNSLEKTMHTVKLGGEDVKLSTAQLMELYVLMKREQAVEHILIGGILPDTTEGKRGKLNTKAEPARSLSMAEITEALSNLTEEQKKIADELQKYVSTVLAEYGNEASMKVYNYQKFLEKNYWTIRTNKQEIASEIGKETAVTSVANKGMAKGTKPHANTSVRIGSIFDTFATHSSDMATYAAWLGTTEDVNRIRNFVFKENGARTGTVKGILDTVHGIHGSDYLQKLLTDVSIGVKGTDNMNPFDKLIGSYKAASVGANLRVIIQQPTAILRALDMIDAHHLATGAINPLKGWEKAKKYAPIAQWKDWGHFDINTGRQMKDVLYDNASLLEKTKQVGMWGASMTDSLAWGQLWNAVEAETKAKHKELEVGSDEYYETVAKRFTEIVDHTQVVDGIMQRSQIMRSSDALTKMATSFMGEPTKQYNMAISAAYDAVNVKGDARKKAVAKLGRTAMSLVVAGIVNACAQSIIDAMRDDDKEKDYWEKWLGAFIGDEDDKMVQKFGNLGDTFNPLSYVPFVKDVVSVFSGYDVKRMDMEAITKTSNAVANMYKAVTGTGKYTIAEASAQLFVEAARLWGLPVANVKRDVKSLVTSVAIQTDNYLLQYRMEKAMLDINYAGNSKNFMDILFNAYNNDKKAYEFIYNDLIKSGYKLESIKDGMNNRLMKAEGVKNVSELSKRYMTPSTEKKYDSSLKKIKSSDAWKSANATQRKNAEADVYDFLTSDSKTMQKTREDARAFGVDETEYALWQLATEMVDQPKGQKGNGSYNAKEKAEAIKMLDFDNSELAYFYNTEMSKKAYAGGVDIENFAKFKAAVSGLKDDNKKAYVDYYADKYADNAKEYLFFMGSEYSSYKKRSDYIKYFGK